MNGRLGLRKKSALSVLNAQKLANEFKVKIEQWAKVEKLCKATRNFEPWHIFSTDEDITFQVKKGPVFKMVFESIKATRELEPYLPHEHIVASLSRLFP